MARLLVIMGSGETTPTMVTPHQRVLAALGDAPTARLIDTPYGFQENADDITARTLAYFARNVGVEVDPVSLRDVTATGPGDLEAAQVAVREADWLFAGPGSPSYVLRQWRGTAVPELLTERLGRPGATVFASAAAVTVGSHAIPVYEIYKAGDPPHWLEGLDLLAELGWNAVVIPHFDNAEGGTHDTRYCYLGERRLRTMEAELPDDTWILGVDEHTAAVLDLDAGTLAVQGRGGVTVRAGAADVTVFPAGTSVTFADVLAAARGTRPATGGAAGAAVEAPEPATHPAPPTETPFLEELERADEAFDAALADDDAVRAGEHALAVEALIRAWSADTNVSDEVERAGRVLRSMIVRLARTADAGLHDHREVVAPHVETLIDLREVVRGEGRYDLADLIRDELVRAGVEVRDTPGGTEWHYEDPLP